MELVVAGEEQTHKWMVGEGLILEYWVVIVRIVVSIASDLH